MKCMNVYIRYTDVSIIMLRTEKKCIENTNGKQVTYRLIDLIRKAGGLTMV